MRAPLLQIVQGRNAGIAGRRTDRIQYQFNRLERKLTYDSEIVQSANRPIKLKLSTKDRGLQDPSTTSWRSVIALKSEDVVLRHSSKTISQLRKTKHSVYRL